MIWNVGISGADRPGFAQGNRPRRRAEGSPAPRPSTALLGLLATALDAASRLDALASVAPASVREGLIERMAWREAAVGSHRSRHGCIHSIWRCALWRPRIICRGRKGSRGVQCRTPMPLMRVSRGKPLIPSRCLMPRPPRRSDHPRTVNPGRQREDGWVAEAGVCWRERNLRP